MWRSGRAGGATFVVILALAMGGGGANAASEVDVGGQVEQGMLDAQRALLNFGGGGTSAAQGMQLEVGGGPQTALTAFTPRDGGLLLGLGSRAGGPVPEVRTNQLRVGLGDGAIAGFDVGLAAQASMTPVISPLRPGRSALAVGGELAVSSLRFDAAYGDDAELMGFEEGRRVTAGVAYGLGPVDARMSYSLIEQGSEAEQSSLITVGSRLTLRPGFVVQGDVAYADDERGDATTAGRVSLRLNF
jgi:hypothetical protein